MVRISAALIVRDEEEHIGACLASIGPIVDEVIVVDTGSKDATASIAAARGAKVFDVPWRGDFAFARNAALERASGEWILYVDADERVSLTGDLQATIDDPTVIAARVRFRASSRVFPYWEYRLFRNRSDIRFRGVIHESIMPDVLPLVESGQHRIVTAPLAFDHLGYEGDLSRKHRRNHPLLLKAVADDPQRIYLWHTLGEAALGLQDLKGAEDAWRKGLAVIRQRPPQAYDVLVYSDLIDLHLSEGGVALPDAAALVEEAAERHPDDPLILWWKAHYLAAQGACAAARSCLETVSSLGKDGPPDGLLGYDSRLFGVLSWALMGTCWLKEGHPEEAVHWLRRAKAADPQDLEISTKLTLAEKLLRP